jgi:hypothetical protein
MGSRTAWNNTYIEETQNRDCITCSIRGCFSRGANYMTNSTVFGKIYLTWGICFDLYIYIPPPLFTHCPPPSPCQNLSEHTTPPPSSWLARPFNTTHWTLLLYKHMFLTPWHPFYLRPWRWDKEVILKRWSYTKNWRWATTQKILSNMMKLVLTFCSCFTIMPKNENIKIVHEFKMNKS